MFSIIEVARATTAAPWYFKRLCIKDPMSKGSKKKIREEFIDGGFGTANNPTWEAYLETD